MLRRYSTSMTADERFDRIDQSIERLENYLLEFRTEVIQRMDLADQQSNLNFTSLSVRLSNE